MTIQTPAEIAAQIERDHYNDDAWQDDPDFDGEPLDALADAVEDRAVTADEIRAMMREAIEADRASQQDGWENTIPRELASALSDRGSHEAAQWLKENETDSDLWDLIGDLLDKIEEAWTA